MSARTFHAAAYTASPKQASLFEPLFHYLQMYAEIGEPNFGYKLAVESQMRDHQFQIVNPWGAATAAQHLIAEIVVQRLNVIRNKASLFLRQDVHELGVPNFVVVSYAGRRKSQDNVIVTTGYISRPNRAVINKHVTTLRKWIALDKSASEIIRWAGPVRNQPEFRRGRQDVIIKCAA